MEGFCVGDLRGPISNLRSSCDSEVEYDFEGPSEGPAQTPFYGSSRNPSSPRQRLREELLVSPYHSIADMSLGLIGCHANQVH